MPPLRPLLCLVAIVGLNAQPLRAAKPQSGPLVVAHRGLLRHAPENTLSNFAACLELRIGFELDVRRSKDGHLVCVHDETVDRTTNGRGKVTELTLKELKRLDAGSWFEPAFRNERVPTIDEIFALVARMKADSTLIAVDMKGDDENIESDVVKLANKHRVLDSLLFIGRAIQHTEVRERLKQADRSAHVASVANTPKEFLQALNDRHADWVYARYVASREEVTKVHAAGKRMFLAGPTVAGLQQANWRTAAGHGVDAILTDYPLSLRGLLRMQQ